MPTTPNNTSFLSFVSDQANRARLSINGTIERLNARLDHWPTTIALTVLTCRLVLFPVRLFAARNSLLLRHSFTNVRRKLCRPTVSVQDLRDPSFLSAWRQECTTLGCTPCRSLLPMAMHIPAFIALSTAIRELSQEHAVDGMDRLFGMPLTETSVLGAAAICGLNAIILHVHPPLFTTIPLVQNTNKWIGSTGKTAMQAVVYNLAHAVNAISGALLAKMPLAMLVYIFLSCGMSLGEGYLLHRSAFVKRLLERTVPLPTTADMSPVGAATPSSQALGRVAAAAIKK